MRNLNFPGNKTLRILLIPGTVFICFLIIEIGYRLLDPFPYFSGDTINRTQHGNLSQHDPILGWKGVPGGKTQLVTKNARVSLEHNKNGYRDIEHDPSTKKPAIVFLGDSFTWGHEIEFEEMFVNLLREKMPSYEIFNLSHRGYGTDQEFILFKNWNYDGAIKLVILIFFENDLSDNNLDINYMKPKPRYIIHDNKLSLTGVPVPKIQKWDDNYQSQNKNVSLTHKLKSIALKSHFLHDIYFRYRIFKYLKKMNWEIPDNKVEDQSITYRILEELNKSVVARGAKLIVFFIPSKREIENIGNYSPYQNKVIEFCEEIGITCIDLAPDFKQTWRRAYYRYEGGHWNSYGNQIAAESIYNYLTTNPVLKIELNLMEGE